MPRWIVLAVPVSGVSDAGRDGRTVAEFEASPEEAEAALLKAAHTYEHGVWKVRRREIFKCSNTSYVIRLRNRLATYSFLIQLAELVHDSDPR
ncbi:hypothetical protein [Actinacidiphila rubida]|uniref:Uncharacterized protein n=1 Tax=Actinacidiphila rubida TaxID=310780 RepID=A0A1H8K5C0_9ACTN|nr:hypothetical protein [Actinacidiphila rubida]SEN88200.1 hypothetical protein SAMN05216267_10126 [Actinacidiphila rubida]